MDLIASKVTLNGQALEGRDPDSIDKAKNDTYALVKLSIEDKLLARESATPGSVALFPGSCMRCPGGCKRAQGLPCISPHTLRYSLEAYGGMLGKIAEQVFGYEFFWAAPGEIPPYYLLISAILRP